MQQRIDEGSVVLCASKKRSTSGQQRQDCCAKVSIQSQSHIRST